MPTTWEDFEVDAPAKAPDWSEFAFDEESNRRRLAENITRTTGAVALPLNVLSSPAAALASASGRAINQAERERLLAEGISGTIGAAALPLDILSRPEVALASAGGRAVSQAERERRDRSYPFGPFPQGAVTMTPEEAQGATATIARGIAAPGKALYAGLADVGTALLSPPAGAGAGPLGQVTTPVPPPTTPGYEEPPSNVEALIRGEPLPADYQAAVLPPVARGTLSAAKGLVETAPQLAAIAGGQAMGVPAPLTAAALFGPTEQGFDVKQAAIAAALPVVGKWSGSLAEILATRLGVTSEAAANIINRIGGSTGATAILTADQWNEIRKLPEDKQKDAWVDAIGNIASMGLLGATGEARSRPIDLVRRDIGRTIGGAKTTPEMRRQLVLAGAEGGTPIILPGERPGPPPGFIPRTPGELLEGLKAGEAQAAAAGQLPAGERLLAEPTTKLSPEAEAALQDALKGKPSATKEGVEPGGIQPKRPRDDEGGAPPEAGPSGGVPPTAPKPPPQAPPAAQAPVAPEAPKSPAKEPWQMTKAEWNRHEQKGTAYEFTDEKVTEARNEEAKARRTLDDANATRKALGNTESIRKVMTDREGALNRNQARRDADKAIEVARKEFNKWANRSVGRATHEGYVKRALEAGKPVPPEVLADYPDLKPAPKAEPAPAAPSPETQLDTKFKTLLGELKGAFGSRPAIATIQKVFDRALREEQITAEQHKYLTDRLSERLKSVPEKRPAKPFEEGQPQPISAAAKGQTISDLPITPLQFPIRLTVADIERMIVQAGAEKMPADLIKYLEDVRDVFTLERKIREIEKRHEPNINAARKEDFQRREFGNHSSQEAALAEMNKETEKYRALLEEVRNRFGEESPGIVRDVGDLLNVSIPTLRPELKHWEIPIAKLTRFMEETQPEEAPAPKPSPPPAEPPGTKLYTFGPLGRGTELVQEAITRTYAALKGMLEDRVTRDISPDAPPPPPRRLVADLVDRLLGPEAGETADAVLRKAAGESVPKTMAASAASGNAMVRFASAQTAAPHIARSLIRDVLGDRWNDKAFRERFGAVLVEDRLRAIREGLRNAAAPRNRSRCPGCTR